MDSTFQLIIIHAVNAILIRIDTPEMRTSQAFSYRTPCTHKLCMRGPTCNYPLNVQTIPPLIAVDILSMPHG